MQFAGCPLLPRENNSPLSFNDGMASLSLVDWDSTLSCTDCWLSGLSAGELWSVIQPRVAMKAPLVGTPGGAEGLSPVTTAVTAAGILEDRSAGDEHALLDGVRPTDVGVSCSSSVRGGVRVSLSRKRRS